MKRSGPSVTPGRGAKRKKAAAAVASHTLPTVLGGIELFMAPESQTGYRCVTRSSTSMSRPFEVRVSRNGRKETLGCFATVLEAALCFACHKHGVAFTGLPNDPSGAPSRDPTISAAGKSQMLPLTPDEALQLAHAEGLILLRDPSTVSGFRGVSFSPSDSGPRPYRVRITWRGAEEFIGSYRTAEEAALRYARRIQQLQHEGVVPPKAFALASQEAVASCPMVYVVAVVRGGAREDAGDRKVVALSHWAAPGRRGRSGMHRPWGRMRK